jgi:hypothetical protein
MLINLISSRIRTISRGSPTKAGGRVASVGRGCSGGRGRDGERTISSLDGRKRCGRKSWSRNRQVSGLKGEEPIKTYRSSL